MKTSIFISKFLVVISWVVFILMTISGISCGIILDINGGAFIGTILGALIGICSGASYFALGKILKYTIPKE